MSALFHFKHFTIAQDRCAMKIGTDSMLLGAFSETGPLGRVLDIGTGTGVLALMMAQKIFLSSPDTKTLIDAIEIDPDASVQAAENAMHSPWGNKINVINTSLADFIQRSAYKYDAIICNPPYFEKKNRDKGKNLNLLPVARASARSMEQLNFDELLDGVNSLLAPDGEFTLILPFGSLPDFKSKAEARGLYFKKLIYIRSYKEEPPIRFIGLLTRALHSLKESEFIIYSSYRKYSDGYKELTREFHGKNLA